eukprot:GFUD01010186.1.p1 GENE.GFUD01010186.1~~GFUD01010186.1.p1  ORF type:complete len:284 (-),score=69.96 GFUD01010186.1:87-938(-)
MTPGMIALSCKEFTTNASNTVRNLYSDQHFIDVTIACDDEQIIKAHKVILSSSSSFFRHVLVENPHEHPLICLTGVKFDQMQQIIEFIYLGEVRIAEEEVNSFIELGRELEIGGIIDQQFEQDTSMEVEVPEKNIASSIADSDSCDPLQVKEIIPLDDVKAEDFPIVDIKEEFDEDLEAPKVLRKERKFGCNKCDFTSVHYASVRKHKISKHEGIKYQCDKCEKRFTDSSTLLRHKKSIHDGVVYRCDICQKTFSDGSALTRHTKTQHYSMETLPAYDPFLEF